MKIRFGVIGAGGRSGSLVHTLLQDKEKRGDLIAVCDLRQEALDADEKLVQNSLHHGITKYTDYKELIANPEIDAVIVSTPDHLHHPMAIAALKAKKHLFLEKPVGINLDQMIDIVRTAKASGKIVEIGYVLRYAPFYIEMKRMIDSGEIGRSLFGQALEQYYGGNHFRRGWWRKRANVGGVMIQKICHDMDLHYWMFGKPKKVVAFESTTEFKPGNIDSKAKFCSECTNHCPYYIKDAAHSRTWSDECLYNGDADIADNSQIIIQFESGMNLTMGMNFFGSIGQDDRHWRIVGSKAELTGRLSTGLIRYDARHDHSLSQSKYLEANPPELPGHGGGDSVQMIQFINGICGNHEAKAGLESAYWSSILVMGAQLSADTDKVIEIADLIKKYPFPK